MDYVGVDQKLKMVEWWAIVGAVVQSLVGFEFLMVLGLGPKPNAMTLCRSDRKTDIRSRFHLLHLTDFLFEIFYGEG